MRESRLKFRWIADGADPGFLGAVSQPGPIRGLLLPRLHGLAPTTASVGSWTCAVLARRPPRRLGRASGDDGQLTMACSPSAASASLNAMWSRWVAEASRLGIDAGEMVALIRESSYAQGGTRP